MTMLGKVFAVLLAIVGVWLIVGGVWLLSLGGSAYYLAAGVLVLASAACVWLNRWALASGLYAGMLACTYAWALWESGLDGWALTARLVAPTVLGLGFLAPLIRRRPVAAMVTTAGAVALAAVSIALWTQDPVAGPITATATPRIPPREWASYGGDPGGQRFSPLEKITPANVSKLKVAWTYRTGGPPDGVWAGLEVTPIKVGDLLVVCDSRNVVHAIDAETGQRRWVYDPKVDVKGFPNIRACRGVAHYDVPGATGPCASRILTATLDARMIALDAATGQLCAGFGEGGMADLSVGMGAIAGGYYYISSAPAIVRGKAVIGGWVWDNQKLGEPSGVVRAFDATTGEFAWAWDIGNPGQHGQPPPGQTYSPGTPNSWAPMSVDEALGLVYVPTGNATPDYVGSHRSAEDEKYASAVVAVEADTGEPRWAFQTVHHDLWDYDVGSQPTLVDLPGPNGVIPALIQPGKSGQIFLLDRRDGHPIASVQEVAVPQRGIPGERLSPTQPVSSLPSALGPELTEAMMWGLTPLDQLWCRINFLQARYDGAMTPPQTDRPTINSPGYMGAVSWGGVSVDPERGLMVVNANLMATRHQLLSRAEADALGVAAKGVAGAKTVTGVTAMTGTPYASSAQAFVSPLGAPCQQPPYGELKVIDLASRKVVWSRPFGTARDSGPLGVASHLPIQMGLPNFGGSLTTRSGLIFVAATQERSFRAVDLKAGRILWQDRLPAGGQATPMTYVGPKDGRQYVVLAAGGKTLLQTKMGDYIIAYALGG